MSVLSRRWLRLVPALCLVFAPDDREAGFVAIGAGADPASAFDFVGITPDAVKFDGEGFLLPGKPRGYLATKAAHGDFALRFDWKYELPAGADPLAFDGNGGVLLRVQGPAKVWPVCLQYQLAVDDPGDLFGLDSSFVGKIEVAAQRRASKPPGEWNEGEIELKGDRVVSRINGLEIASGSYAIKSGPIGFQSQGSAIRFRRVRIKAGEPASK